MTFAQLVGRNLVYHWRGNLAVLLGVVVGTAVLTGALFVGDSLTGSLHAMAREQLGWVDQAMVAGRFVRASLADELRAEKVCPAIFLRGSAAVEISTLPAKVRRAGGVTVLGVDDRFWPDGQMPIDAEFWRSKRAEVVLSAALAKELNVKPGDKLTLNVQRTSHVPRETLLGRRQAEEVIGEIGVTVAAVLPQRGIGRFTLKPSTMAAQNAFVPLGLLQQRLDVPGRANALLVVGALDRGLGPLKDLQEQLRDRLTLEDWNLKLSTPEQRARELFHLLDPRRKLVALEPTDTLIQSKWQGRVPEKLAAAVKDDGKLSLHAVIDFYTRERAYLSLTSSQMFLEPALVHAAVVEPSNPASSKHPKSPQEVLIYLADSIAAFETEIAAVVAALDPVPLAGLRAATSDSFRIPYAVVAAVSDSLKQENLVLIDWPESPLAKVEMGDGVLLTYYHPDDEGHLRLRSHAFTLAGRYPLRVATDSPVLAPTAPTAAPASPGTTDDPDWAPSFPGITDKLDIRNWQDPPFPFFDKRLRPRDHDFWRRYRTTPRAYIPLDIAQKMWGSRFGDVTAIRYPLPERADPTKTRAAVAAALLGRLRPEQGGLVFEDVRGQASRASAGGTDFGMLFLAFSVFLIAAALLLVGLLFRLNIDLRASELGVLLATGIRRSTVRRLLLVEGGVLALIGGLLGLAGAVGYAWMLLAYLNANWPVGLVHSFLQLHTRPQSYILGYALAVAVSLLTILWATRVLGKLAPRALLAGETNPESEPVAHRRSPVWPWIALCVVSATGCVALGALTADHEIQASCFFGSGILVLTALVIAFAARLRSGRHDSLIRQGMFAVPRLGMRNAARHRLRSLLTVILLGTASFLVVAVECFHREADQHFYEKTGGSGGFSLLGESDIPLFQDLNDGKAREQLLPQASQVRALQGVGFIPFRVRAGDDASCLNLYQPTRPRLLGAPSALVRRGGFQFAAAETDEQTRSNPWQLLDRKLEDGSIPVFGEANTVKWMLKSGLGQSIRAPDERGGMVTLRVVGLFQDSVFQSELLMSEGNFLKLYPRQEGFSFFLIDAPRDRIDGVREALESGLSAAGFTVTPSARRLESFLAVENTYLATFQALGGLGLLLGAVGLAIVLLRSTWERRGELALLRALGYRRSALGWLVWAENSYLLVIGLGVGAVAALAAVTPVVLGGTGQVPWLRLGGLVLAVLVVGQISGAMALATTLRAPLLPALRRE
jgi:ABC-type antimicrobial peptide transport system permease subunit